MKVTKLFIKPLHGVPVKECNSLAACKNLPKSTHKQIYRGISRRCNFWSIGVNALSLNNVRHCGSTLSLRCELIIV